MSFFIIDNRKLVMRTAALTWKEVGWISGDIPDPVLCAAVISRELDQAGHSFEIMINEKSGYAIVPLEIHTMRTVHGINVEDDVGSIYAFISNEIDCAEKCTEAVKTVIEAAII